jgi:chromosome segregation ATPase
VKYAEFEVARLEMELINAEEARKAEEAAYILLMEEREELEEERNIDEYYVELDIYNFDEELEDLNSDIERLLEANENTTTQSIIDSNIEKISEYREEYFDILDQRTEKETELEDLIDEHNRERADEAAYDERAAKAAEENAEWDAAYQQSIEDYQAANARIVEIQGKIDDYEERQSETEEGSADWDKFQMFLDLYYTQKENAEYELWENVEPYYYEMQW